MKKIFALILAAALALSVIACGGQNEPSSEESTTTTTAETTTEEADTTTEETTEETAPEVKVMSYDEYMAAAVDDEVVIEAYVQAKQGFWENSVTLYTQDIDGAYFIYQAPCTEEDYEKLTPGTKIRVTGRKAEWAGEIEITEGVLEILDGESFTSNPFYGNDYLSDDSEYAGLLEKQNQRVQFVRMQVAARNEEGAAFTYGWDGSGEQGDDLYFNVVPAEGGPVLSMTVETNLCDKDSDVYKAVEALNVGDVIDIEAFNYWYEGPNPHVISVMPTAITGYADFLNAEVDTQITVDTFVQAKQSWWEGKGTFYTQAGEDRMDGAYFLYEMELSEDEYDALVPGTPIRVSGYKSEWSGEVELIDATWEILNREPRVFDPIDVTEVFENGDAVEDSLKEYGNYFVSFNGFTVEASDDAGSAYLYKWDGSGEKGDDLYFKVSKNGKTWQFTVESYLCGEDTDVYKAVEALNVGDVIDMEGFMYWYEGPNPHITSVEVQ